MVVGCLLVHPFPVACELAERPELRGQPVAVATEDGTVWAASAAARSRGVAFGQHLSEAVGLCPTLGVLEGRPALYQSRWEAILEALEEVAFTVEPGELGIAYVDLAELTSLHSSFQAAAEAVLACAPQEFEPRLGIAPSHFSARVAAERARPGQCLAVAEQELTDFLASQPVTTLPLSAETLRRLQLLKLDTLGALSALPRSALAAQFGPEGARAWELAQGRDRFPLRGRPRLQRVRERLSLEAPLVSREALLAAWEQTLSRALRQPAMQGRAARQAVLRAQTERGRCWERTVTFKEALAERSRLWPSLRSVLAQAALPGPVSELELELTGLVEAQGQQLALPATRPRLTERLEESLRQLKARYGCCPVGRVVEVEPWSRIPERRLALIDFDP